MNNLVKALENEVNRTETENGAFALKTTGDRLLDLFSSIGSMRERKVESKLVMFRAAFNEDSALAMKLLFYARDINSGLGERDTFRQIMHWVACEYPECAEVNMYFIPAFGRWDDLYCFVDTPVEKKMWEFMRERLEMDLEAYKAGGQVSLLAKWIASDTSASKKTEELGKKTIKGMGYKGKDYVQCHKNISALRKYLNIPEIAIAAKEYDKIEYSKVPTKVFLKYKKAFARNDGERYSEYISSVSRGEAKMNAKAVTPYEIMTNMYDFSMYGAVTKVSGDALETIRLQWEKMPDLAGGKNAMVMLDTSGSMCVNNAAPLRAGMGLALYFAERNKGEFNGKVMTFSSSPDFVSLDNSASLESRVSKLFGADWGANTNVKAAFRLLLNTAVEYNISKEDMPEALIIVSDMQFDIGTRGNRETYTEYVQHIFEEKGYKAPKLIYWNVNSNSNTFQARRDDAGVLLVSGDSVNTFKVVLDGIDKSPLQLMLDVLMSERYSMIKGIA